MAGRLPIHFPDGWLQVMSRANDGEALCRQDADRRRFLSLVAELLIRFKTAAPRSS